MRQLNWLLASLLLWSCGTVLEVKQIPAIVVGEAKFFRTIEAHTDAPVTSGNRIDILLDGDETFPVMLDEIRKAKSSITFAQYLYEDGSIARELAHAFADRCRAGVKTTVLLDRHGSGKVPPEIIATMKDVAAMWNISVESRLTELSFHGSCYVTIIEATGASW
jgi:phosphatidylserine/phosphatidylglycerophosphate/cardiolipin synthase-like enzyme